MSISEAQNNALCCFNNGIVLAGEESLGLIDSSLTGLTERYCRCRGAGLRDNSASRWLGSKLNLLAVMNSYQEKLLEALRIPQRKADRILL